MWRGFASAKTVFLLAKSSGFHEHHALAVSVDQPEGEVRVKATALQREVHAAARA